MNPREGTVSKNRTGLKASPGNEKAMLDNINVEPDSDGQDTAAELREVYLEDMRQIGSTPAPPSLKGMAKAGLERLKGHRADVLIDKMAERLAFERMGTRLYEALFLKCHEKESSFPHTQQVEQFHGEELEHVHLLMSCIEELGADPTALTPSADIVGVTSAGVAKVITDPRTTVAQSLEALLVAELTDNDGWELLVNLADEVGHDELASRFRRARDQEQDHLRHVRQWVKSDVMSNAAGR